MSENISSCVSPVSRLCIEKEAVVSIPAVTNHPTRGQINTILWRLAMEAGKVSWLAAERGCYRGYQPTINTDPTLPSARSGSMAMSVSQIR